MRTGRLYIDGQDAYTEYGVYVVEGGYDELICMPPLKAPESNDWQEEDGEEPDLASPQLDTKEVSLRLAVSDVYYGYNFLIEKLSDGALHTFDCRDIGRTCRLRMVSMPSLQHVQTLGCFTLKLANDFPMEGYEYQAPSSTLATDTTFLIDNKPLTDYGCTVLEGIADEAVRSPEVKKNLLRNIETLSGAEYDPQTVTYKSKEIKVTLLLRARTFTELWRNYDALLYDLTRPGEREFDIGITADKSPCYYKSCKVDEFYPVQTIWLKFTLTLVLVNHFRVMTEPLLATESSLWVITEDGDNNDYITLKPDV